MYSRVLITMVLLLAVCGAAFSQVDPPIRSRKVSADTVQPRPGNTSIFMNGKVGIGGVPSDVRGAMLHTLGKGRFAVQNHSWPTASDGSEGANWGPRDAWLYGISDSGGIAVAGFARSSDLGWLNTETEGVAGFVINDSAGRNVWALYGDVQHDTGTYAFGLELAIKNKSNNYSSTPYSGGLGTYGIWLAAGGDPSYGGAPTNPSNTAIMIGKNGSTWNRGILFRSDGLTGADGTTGTASAIMMGKGHIISWRGPGDIQGASIRSDVATSGKDVSMLFRDSTVNFYGTGGSEIITSQIAKPSALNYLEFSNSATHPGITALGSGSNVNVAVTPKGAGALTATRGSFGTTTASSTFFLVTPDNEVTRVGDNETDATQKDFRFGVSHYTNSEEPMALLMGQSGATTNVLSIGGGTGLMNAATSIGFFTAINNTTTSGTERLTISSTGNVGVGDASPSAKFTVGSGDLFQVNTTGDVLIPHPVPSVTITESNVNTDFSTLAQARDTSSTDFTFTPTGKPTFKITGATGLNILELDSLGGLISGNYPTSDATLLGVMRRGMYIVRDSAYVLNGVTPEFGLASFNGVGGGGLLAGMRFLVAGGTSAAPALTKSGAGGFLGFIGHDGTNFVTGSKALISLKAAENWTPTAQGTTITIETTPIGSTTRAAAVTIGNDKNLTLAGAVRSIAGTTTESLAGLTAIADTVERSGQTAAISAVNFNNITGYKAFKVSGYVQTTTASGSGTPTLTVTYSYTDDVGATTQTPTTTHSLSATGRTVLTPTIIYVASGTPTWATSITGASGSPVYKLSLILERLY